MTSFDFLSGFNNIDPKFILDAIDLMQTVEASDAEKEIMNMENYTIHKKRTVRRSVLVAAAVIALLCAMCVGAYAVNLFGIRDAVMGRQIVSDSYVNGEYAGKKLADLSLSELDALWDHQHAGLHRLPRIRGLPRVQRLPQRLRSKRL